MNYDYRFQSDNGGMPPVNLGNTPGKNGRNMAISSFVLAIVSIILPFFGCFCINLIPAIISIVFAVISAKRDGKMSVFAIIGLVLSIICIVLTLIFIGFIVYIGVELVRNPDGKIAIAAENALDGYFQQLYGMGFREYIDQLYGNSATTQK